MKRCVSKRLWQEIDDMEKIRNPKNDASYLFKFLLMANMCLYLEAGAIPAMLIQISEAFDMSPGLQGVLGGIAYLSLGFGSPFAGYLMRNYNHKLVLGYAIGVNSFLTLLWSLTPVGYWYSSALFIFIRFLMGLMQCVVCVFLPLWTNEFAPASERTKWMGALQASVPFGVMGGYIIAAVMIGPVSGETICSGLFCWRWPLLVEWVMLVPFCIAVHFVPMEHLVMRISDNVELENRRQLLATSSFDIFPDEEGKNDVDVSNYAAAASLHSSSVNPKTPLKKYKSRQYSSVGEIDIGFSRLSPEAEELQRRSLRSAEQNTIAASLFTSYSIGDTLHKSPADINPFTILVTDHEFDSNNEFEAEAKSEHVRSRSRSRSNSEPSNIDYSRIHDIMSGISHPKLEIMEKEHQPILLGNPPPLSPQVASPYSKENQTDQQGYQSLSSLIKKNNRDSVLRSESIDEWTDGHRVTFSEKRPSTRAISGPGYQYTEVDCGKVVPELDPSRLSKDQDSDLESESDAFAYLFDPIRSPVKRQSLKLSESIEEYSSVTTRCFENVSHLISNINSLFKIPVYRYLLFALASLYFVVTGIQFWATSYMLVVLSAPHSIVNTMFVICAGTGPTLGVFYGGWIIDKMGGYMGSKQRVISLKICLFTGILAGIFATIGSLVENFITFICCLWLILFFGASLLPACTGMLVSVVPRKYRAISSSLSIFIFNIFGYSFSLFLSGYLMQIVGFYFPGCDVVCSRKIGFRFILLWSYWSLFFLILAVISAIQYDNQRGIKG